MHASIPFIMGLLRFFKWLCKHYLISFIRYLIMINLMNAPGFLPNIPFIYRMYKDYSDFFPIVLKSASKKAEDGDIVSGSSKMACGLGSLE